MKMAIDQWRERRERKQRLSEAGGGESCVVMKMKTVTVVNLIHPDLFNPSVWDGGKGSPQWLMTEESLDRQASSHQEND